MNPQILQEPALHTSRFHSLGIGDLLPNEQIILADDATESRGQLPLWKSISNSNPDRFIKIKQKSNDLILVQKGTNPTSEVAVTDEQAINEIVSTEHLLIDISGLPQHVWAPLLKSAYTKKTSTRILYAEPESYKFHPSPASATIFDLSVRFSGLGPLPGFARLTGPIDETKCLFVAMLGFEGNRPEHLVMHIDPTPKIIPVVGVPGFQLEYPAFTIACNRNLLEDYSAHSDIRYARASCPFEAYHTLKEIRKDYPEHYMYLAPIGTKPHALGTILYAIANPDSTEIMFDHPVRKPGRTKGIGIIHIYNYGKFDAT